MKDYEEELELLSNLPMLAPGGGFSNSPLARVLLRKDAELQGSAEDARSGRMQIVITEKGQRRLIGPRTPCCGVYMMGLGGDPNLAVVCWNPYNRVVQCHACGEIYTPAAPEDDAYSTWKAAGGGLQFEPKEWWSDDANIDS